MAHIVVACSEEHHKDEKTVSEVRGRVGAACADELEAGAACVTGGGDWNDAVVGTKGKLDHHSDHCGYFPDQTTADCHIDDDTGWQVVRMRSVALLLQGSNARGVVTLDGIRVPWAGFYRIQGTVV